MWVEVFEKKDRVAFKKWDISPPPVIDLELRLIVWETSGIPMMDDEGTSDIYVVSFVDTDLKQSTDCHYRCQTGRGSFNWRVILPLSTPSDKSKLQVQVFDNDFFSFDDYISGCTLDLARIMKEVYYLDIPIKFSRSYWDGLTAQEKQGLEIQFQDGEEDKFWINLKRQGDVYIILFILEWRND